jgi:hypothetical protein
LTPKLAAWRPWKPVVVNVSPVVGAGIINKADAIAIRAVAQGDASPDQQKRAIEAIIGRIACTDDMSFRAEDHGGMFETAFAEGKRYVGLQIRKMIHTPLHILTGENTSLPA